MIKDIYKQCKNNVLSSEPKEAPKAEEKEAITSDFIAEKPVTDQADYKNDVKMTQED